MKIRILYRFIRNNWRLFSIVFLVLLLSSCASTKLSNENRKLKSRIIDLEQRIYELTDSPEHLSDETMQDVNLLMTIPSRENLELAMALINGFKQSYPKMEYYRNLDAKAQEIHTLLSPENQSQLQRAHFGIQDQRNGEAEAGEVHLQFNVEVSKRSQGFVNVKLMIQNMSKTNISNLWLKASLTGLHGETYGITQDFFFNRIAPYEQQEETLSWEYVKLDQIVGAHISQMRYNQNRQNKKLKKEECSVGQGNVKIFLDF